MAKLSGSFTSKGKERLETKRRVNYDFDFFSKTVLAMDEKDGYDLADLDFPLEHDELDSLLVNNDYKGLGFANNASVMGYLRLEKNTIEYEYEEEYKYFSDHNPNKAINENVITIHGINFRSINPLDAKHIFAGGFVFKDCSFSGFIIHVAELNKFLECQFENCVFSDDIFNFEFTSCVFSDCFCNCLFSKTTFNYCWFQNFLFSPRTKGSFKFYDCDNFEKGLLGNVESFENLEREVTILYRYFSKNNTLLYVGISKSAFVRQQQHSIKSNWYQEAVRCDMSERYETREEALAAEKIAIEKEKPLHNIMHNQ